MDEESLCGCAIEIPILFYFIYFIYLTDPVTYELMGDEVQNVKQEGEEEDSDTDKEKGLSDNYNSIYTNSRHR